MTQNKNLQPKYTGWNSSGKNSEGGFLKKLFDTGEVECGEKPKRGYVKDVYEHYPQFQSAVAYNGFATHFNKLANGYRVEQAAKGARRGQGKSELAF
jgi:hypothetical protein